MFSLPAEVSEIRYPDNSKYYARGCLFETMVVVDSGAPAFLSGFDSGAGAEHAASMKISATGANLTVSYMVHVSRLKP